MVAAEPVQKNNRRAGADAFVIERELADLQSARRDSIFHAVASDFFDTTADLCVQPPEGLSSACSGCPDCGYLRVNFQNSSSGQKSTVQQLTDMLSCSRKFGKDVYGTTEYATARKFRSD